MSKAAVLVDSWLTGESKANPLLNQILAVAFGVAGLSLLAQVVIQLPFTPVPITGQTLGILVIAGGMGRNLSCLTVLAYILLGSLGMPIFADQSGGIHVLFGATGGYLVGFLAAAWVMGSLAQKGWDRALIKSLAMFTLGHGIIFGCGMLWLKAWAPELNVLQAGLLPFLPGAVVKTLIATGLFPLIWKLRG